MMYPKARKNNLTHQGILILALVFFSLIVLFFNLGKRNFWEPDEGRYAEISREMAESGDWLTPRLNYIKHFDKPPMVYWLIGSSFKLFGQNEFAGHLPLVILGLAGVLLTFALGKRLFGSRCGFLAAVILISSLGYPALARILSTDIIFSFFCLLCYLFFIRRNYLLFYFSLALAFMTKGPVALVITLIPITVFLLYEKQLPDLKRLYCGFGIILFLALGLPWYIYQILQNQGLLNDWVVQHTLNRIVREIKQPFYFFIPVLIGLFFPWIFFFVPALKGRLYFKRAALDDDHAKMLLLFFWFALPFLFFSCIGKKLVPYILPLLPPLAIMIARLWAQAWDNPKILVSKIFTVSSYIFLSCLGILAAAVIIFLSLGFEHKLNIAAAHPNIVALPVILAAGIIVALYALRSRKVKWLFWAIACTSMVFFLTAIDLLPKIEANIGRSIKPLAMKIKQDLSPEDKVVNYRCFLKGLPFYLGRRTIVVERQRNIAYEEDPGQLPDYLLKDKTALYGLLSAKDVKVYCITYTWEFQKIEQEYQRPLYLLGRAGKYVLFANKQ